MRDIADAGALCRTYLEFLRLPCEAIDGPGCRVVRQDATPLVYMANHLQLTPGATLDPEAVFAFLEAELGHLSHRFVVTVPYCDEVFQAKLVEADFRPMPVWQGLLKGELRGDAPPECDIRRAVSDEDWAHFDRLVRADHVESDARMERSVFTPEVTAQMQAMRRLGRRDEVHVFLAWEDDAPVAFLTSWPGVDGVGMVEDLFTLPNHRQRGLARALIHHCVADARARGAVDVLIGAFHDDTPKNAYAAMGFETTCLTWEWLKTPTI